MVKLNQQIKVGKLGVNYITNVVDESGCNFHEIVQENDVGIDGQIEIFSEKGIPTGQIISLQVKTGKSYYDLDKQECIIPINGHEEYWLNFQLPVYGIVCVLDDTYNEVILAYWVDIKKYLKRKGKCSTIRFKMCKNNEFTREKFRKYFCCLINNKLPNISFEETKDLLVENDQEDRRLAVDELQINYSMFIESWKIVFDLYENGRDDIDDFIFFDSISYALSHPDKWYEKNKHEFSVKSKEYVIETVNDFNEADIIRALKTIEQHFFDRGTMGQTIEIVIRNVDRADVKLLNIVLNENIDIDIRIDAEMILAFQYKDFYIKNVTEIKRMNSEITHLICEAITEFGEFEIY